MSAGELQINAHRLARDLEDLSLIGRQDDKGIFRMAFTPADMEAREWFRKKTEESGLEFYQDGAANVFARLGWDGETPSVLSGSHIDTVPGAGHLDGALGVVCALECLRVLKESRIDLKRPLEAVAFSDEEGRFGGVFGSQALAGLTIAETLQSATDLDGVSLADCMAQFDLNVYDALNARRAPGSIYSYVELHIEQGPVLERQGHSIGVVDAITGLFKWEVTLQGVANHAGTTPMNMRNDAFQGLAEFAGQIDRIIAEHGSPHSTITIGHVDVRPGAANVIPGKAVFSLDIRDTDPRVLHEMSEALQISLKAISQRRELSLHYSILSDIAPVSCASKVVRIIDEAVEAAGVSAMHLNSGAAHDAQIVAGIAPAGMIFVPSQNGCSHDAKEWTSAEDIEAGCNVLVNTLRRLANS